MEISQMHGTATPEQSFRKEVTLQDVALAGRVSVSTVSSVLNDKGRFSAHTRDRVKRVARELGFIPNPAAQRLVNGHQDNTVALFSLYLDQNVVSRKLEILQDILTEDGYSAPIYAFGNSLKVGSIDQTKMMRDLLRLRPRAFACHTGYLNEHALHELRGFSERGGVVVCYDKPVELVCDQVILDREHNSYLAMRHLLELGHRRIGFYLGYLDPDPWRLAGVKRALREYDAPFLTEWLNYVGTERYVKGGAQLGEFFLNLRERPTAVCIVNDLVATGFVTYVAKRGVRVPEDVSVIGHDNVPIAEFGSIVPLTTVSNPVEKIARQVAECIAERLRNEYSGASRRFDVKGDLVVRESTAALA
jgi:DNA-binding LacI/PurR family transcriptional regulator